MSKYWRVIDLGAIYFSHFSNGFNFVSVVGWDSGRKFGPRGRKKVLFLHRVSFGVFFRKIYVTLGATDDHGWDIDGRVGKPTCDIFFESRHNKSVWMLTSEICLRKFKFSITDSSSPIHLKLISYKLSSADLNAARILRSHPIPANEKKNPPSSLRTNRDVRKSAFLWCKIELIAQCQTCPPEKPNSP